jgi:hypothetical protein
MTEPTLALSVRQPWAELILSGHKTIEVRSRSTSVRARVYIYAAQTLSTMPEAARSASVHGLELDALPRGLLVGSVAITGCARLSAADSSRACFDIVHHLDHFGWELGSPQRFQNPRRPERRAQPVFFRPF